jgi:hypothetical protein
MLKVLVAVLLFVHFHVFSQAIPNPCRFDKINCGLAERNMLFTSFNEDTIIYAPPGRSMPFWFALGDAKNGIIDTSGAYNFSLSKISGPGDIKGVPGTLNGYYSYLEDISFSEIGTYIVHVNVSGFPGSFVGKLVFIVPPEINFCSESPSGGCVNGKGNQIFAKPQETNVIPVDAVIPIKVGVVDSLTGLLDSSYSGTIYVDKFSGPGELYGILSMTGIKWFDFNQLKFSEEGIYTIRFHEENPNRYKEEYIEVEVISTSTGLKVISWNDLKIYPNPIQDEIKISSEYDLKGNIVTITNSTGQILYKNEISSTKKIVFLKTSHLKKGIYFITFSDMESSMKIVK